MVRRIERQTNNVRIRKRVILCDDREKNGWDSDYLGPGFEVIRKRLDTGDYTIKGMEHLVCIEKKSSWQEIAMNIGSKRNLVNFKKELERMGDFPIRFLVIHEDPSHIYHTRTYSKHIGKNTLMLWYMRIQVEYGIPTMCVGNKAIAKNMIRLLFNKIIQFHEQGRLYYHGTNQNELYQ